MGFLFTIGYSGLNSEAFADLLIKNNVDVVCDVRSTPYSSYKPDFSRGPFRAFLNKFGIKYAFMGDQLGARPADRSCYDGGQATYERISASEPFKAGLNRLRSGVGQLNLALVCSERDPLECHRAVLVCRNLYDLHPHIKHIHCDGSVETQQEFDERLVSFQNLTPPPLLQRPGDWERAVALAYERQGDGIAYRERGYESKNGVE